MDKVKIGIAGCGSSVNMFIASIKYVENGEITAIMDINPEKVKAVGEMYDIRHTYTDYEEMLDESGIDAVIICTPPVFHAEQTIIAAQKKIHVLCEKPMAPSVSECARMIRACEENGVNLMIGLMKRFDKSMRYAKQLIDSGELGDVHQLTTKWSWYGGEMRCNGKQDIMWRELFKYTRGGIFQDHGSHVTDLSRWWLGEIQTVSAEINIIKEGAEVEDNVNAIYRHKSGAVSIHMQSRTTHKELTEYYLIDGSKASLEIYFDKLWSFTSNDPFTMYIYRKGRFREDVTLVGDPNTDIEISKNGRYKNELQYFCKCIIDGTKPSINTGEDGMKSIEAVNAVYLSSYLGSKITLPLSEELAGKADLEEIFKEAKHRSIRKQYKV